MMNTPLKEWLNQTIAELEEERDAVPGAVNEDAAMALAAMKLALSTLEAEPVAYIFKHPAGRLFWSLTDESNKGQSDVMPVYTAQPVPVFVPDELTREVYKRRFMEDDDFDDTFRGGWKAHRAAMLKHSAPFIVTSDHRMMEMPQVEAINAVTAILQGADGALTNEDTKSVGELVMWVKRLAHSLRKANPDSKLQSDAMDYLSRKGLIGVEDILR